MYSYEFVRRVQRAAVCLETQSPIPWHLCSRSAAVRPIDRHIGAADGVSPLTAAGLSGSLQSHSAYCTRLANPRTIRGRKHRPPRARRHRGDLCVVVWYRYCSSRRETSAPLRQRPQQPASAGSPTIASSPRRPAYKQLEHHHCIVLCARVRSGGNSG